MQKLKWLKRNITVGCTRVLVLKAAVTSATNSGEHTTDLAGGTMVDMVATVTMDIKHPCSTSR